jgi:hypothetical protein
VSVGLGANARDARVVTATPPFDLLRPRRSITGMSAVLLPFQDPETPDIDGFLTHLVRTVDAGLVPAINMDTGFGPTIGAERRAELLRLARDAVVCEVVAGAHVLDSPGDGFDADALHREVDALVAAGATPILFPSHGLAALEDDQIVEEWAAVGERVERFLGFELGKQFHPAGRILGLDAYESVLSIPTCVGAKHSSLERSREWDRLRVRDRVRPDFMVLTGNDLAVDMVCYGADYLLGITTFAPDLFAERDRRWAAGSTS